MSDGDSGLITDLFELNKRLSLNLWHLAAENDSPLTLSPRVIYPLKRDGTIRISEQEARIVCCGLLNNLSLYYSVETPTRQRYVQKGKNKEGMSAQTDLTVYSVEDKSFSRICNIEFKAHNCDKSQIAKDIEKLVRERTTGNWFHILKNTNRGTIGTLFKKFQQSFLYYSQSFARLEISIVFCYCILDKQELYIRHFLYDPAKQEYKSYIGGFFDALNLHTDWHIFAEDFGRGYTEQVKGTRQRKGKHRPLRGYAIQKSWHYWQAQNGEDYILAFVNRRGSCSLRRFKAESGQQIDRLPNQRGDYQDKFFEYLRAAKPLHLSQQPNLENECKDGLPECVMNELKPQIRAYKMGRSQD